MKLGFTGTQRGMTKSQLYYVRAYIGHPSMTEFHHGDCIGADAEFHDAIAEVWDPEEIVEIHPPENPSKRAWKKGRRIWPEKPYLVRNKDIVNYTDRLLATPGEEIEILRSGTWSTIRYARRMGHPITVILPSGLIRRVKRRASA